MNFKWLWITYKQLNIQEDFATWAIRDGLVNKELYCRKDEIYEYHIPKEVTQYHIPKEVSQKLLTNNYNNDMMIIQIDEEMKWQY